MLTNKTRSGYGLHIQRIKTIRAALTVIVIVVAVSVAIPLWLRLKDRTASEKKELLRLWEDAAYQQAFELSKAALEAKPLDYFLLTINGFSAYQVGISQINSLDTQNYIDECIRSLRKALLIKAEDGRVCYVLGKAYSYKGSDYADLAVRYLKKAQDFDYSAADTAEYLGLAYAAIGDYRASVASFSEALKPSGEGEAPPDLLLLSIAHSYMALEEYESARAYLTRCIELSHDSKSILTARLSLAEVFLKLGDAEGAEKQYLAVLSESGEYPAELSRVNAEAHYQLGELYSQQGDAAKARSEWRLAYRTDPAHARARAKLNI
jgi:tetratricopeptide (TPR) repeat protein